MSNKERVVTIMDIPFINCTQSYFLHHKIVPKLEKKEKCFIVTANPEIVMETERNPAYKKIVQSADYVVADGVGILLAAKIKKDPIEERIAGFDLMNEMLQVANKEAARCFFLGATAEVNEQAVKKISQTYPDIHIVGHRHGYFDIQDESVVEQVKQGNPDFIFVALGFPKQEEWISRYLPQFSQGIFMGVGGSFDVFAGNVKRAPNIWIKLNLEWLYRLLKQPFRWKRMIPIFKFLLLSIRGKRSE